MVRRVRMKPSPPGSVQISSLPDLSRFVKREKKLKIYNTIQLVIGEVKLEVSGPVISQASDTLQKLAGESCELYLDGFDGEMDGIQDCIELLYGGEVVLTDTNVKTVLKFSIIYQVKEMFDLCLRWFTDNMSSENLFSSIHIGSIIERIGYGELVGMQSVYYNVRSTNVLDICAKFIEDNVKHEFIRLFQMKDDMSSKFDTWSSDVGSVDGIFKFLAREDILRFTLPVLTSLVVRDADVSLILSSMIDKGTVEWLSEHGKLSVDLLGRMAEKVETFETTSMLNKVQAEHAKYEAANARFPVNKAALADLVRNFRSFTIDKLIQTELSLKPFQYMDLIYDWILSNRTSFKFTEKEMKRLWATVRHRHLSQGYLHHIETGIKVYTGRKWDEYQGTYKNHRGWIGSRQLYKVDSRDQFDFECFIDKSTMICNVCQTEFDMKITFVDAVPCYEVECSDSDHQVDHVYLNHYTRGSNYVFYSLFTNNYESVKEKIEEIWAKGDNIYVTYISASCTKDI